MRDLRGRFIGNRIANDVNGGVNFLWELFRMFPILICLYFMWVHYGFGVTLKHILMEILCGAKDCSCQCKDKNNGGWS